MAAERTEFWWTPEQQGGSDSMRTVDDDEYYGYDEGSETAGSPENADTSCLCSRKPVRRKLLTDR